MTRRTKQEVPNWFVGVAGLVIGFLTVELFELLREGWRGLIDILEGDE